MATQEAMAGAVASRTGAILRIKNISVVSDQYDPSSEGTKSYVLSTKKFQKRFGFVFTESAEAIVDDLFQDIFRYIVAVNHTYYMVAEPPLCIVCTTEYHKRESQQWLHSHMLALREAQISTGAVVTSQRELSVLHENLYFRSNILSFLLDTRNETVQRKDNSFFELWDFDRLVTYSRKTLKVALVFTDEEVT